MLKKTIKTLSRILTVLCVSLILLTNMSTVTKAEGENTELPKESYTVKYLESETKVPLVEEKVVTDITVGTEITEKAIEITNYKLVGEMSQTFTIQQTTVTKPGKRIRDGVSIKFNKGEVPEETTVGLLPNDEEIESVGSYQISADIPTRDDGYEFIGYTLTTKQEKTEPTTEVVASNEIVFYYDKLTYKVTYVVNPDPKFNTPEGSTVPTDPTKYLPGEKVDVAAQLTTTVGYAYNEKGEKVKGTWEFVTWDKDDFEIYADTTITGGWTFSEAAPVKYKYTVHYVLWDDFLKGKTTKVADDKEIEIYQLGIEKTEPAKTGNDLKPKYRKNYIPVPGYESKTEIIRFDGYEIWIFYQKKSSSS